MKDRKRARLMLQSLPGEGKRGGKQAQRKMKQREDKQKLEKEVDGEGGSASDDAPMDDATLAAAAAAVDGKDVDDEEAAAEEAKRKEKESAQTLTFGARLAHTDKEQREKGFTALARWLQNQTGTGEPAPSKKGSKNKDAKKAAEKAAKAREELTEEKITSNFIKLWKSLWYGLWMADKRPVQQEYCARAAMLSSQAVPRKYLHIWIACFFEVFQNEWGNLDTHRMNKFRLMVRIQMAEVFVILAGKSGDFSTAAAEKKSSGEKKSSKKTDEAPISSLELADNLNEVYLGCAPLCGAANRFHPGFAMQFVQCFWDELLPALKEVPRKELAKSRKAQGAADAIEDADTEKARVIPRDMFDALLEPFLEILTSNDKVADSVVDCIVQEICAKVPDNLVVLADEDSDDEKDLSALDVLSETLFGVVSCKTASAGDESDDESEDDEEPPAKKAKVDEEADATTDATPDAEASSSSDGPIVHELKKQDRVRLTAVVKYLERRQKGTLTDVERETKKIALPKKVQKVNRKLFACQRVLKRGIAKRSKCDRKKRRGGRG